jgi:Zn-dependent peptidase ImmA (M78 family)
MSSIFRRLNAVGFDRNFVRRVVLPDWWDDALANDPASRWQIELRIAQRLGIAVEELADQNRPLSPACTNGVRFKRAQSTAARESIAPGMIAARRAVALLLPHVRQGPQLPAKLTALEIRRRIQKKRSPVDLAGILDVCWEVGIAVFRFNPLPSKTRKFAGMAYFEGGRPVIVLASGYDSPPRLAFHLAHELSHILRGHVVPGGDVLVDSDLDRSTEDAQEREADGDALEIITGDRDPCFEAQYGLTAHKLVKAARKFEAEHQVHAGSIALVYGGTAERMPVAVAALKLMNMDAGASAVLSGALQRNLPAPHELSGDALEILPLVGLGCTN